MSNSRRLWEIFVAVITIFGAVVLMFVPDIAFSLIAAFVGLALTFRGLKFLIYYLTHARLMVGGKRLLLVGLILFDMGVFASLIYDQTQFLTIIYVIAIHAVWVVLRFARAVSNKGDGNPGWKLDFAQGIGNLIQVILCLVFINSIEIPVFIYCIGVIYESVLKIVAACRKTGIVYVQ